MMKAMKSGKNIAKLDPKGNASAKKGTLPKAGANTTLNPNRGAKMGKTRMQGMKGY